MCRSGGRDVPGCSQQEVRNTHLRLRGRQSGGGKKQRWKTKKKNKQKKKRKNFTPSNRNCLRSVRSVTFVVKGQWCTKSALISLSRKRVAKMQHTEVKMSFLPWVFRPSLEGAVWPVGVVCENHWFSPGFYSGNVVRQLGGDLGQTPGTLQGWHILFSSQTTWDRTMRVGTRAEGSLYYFSLSSFFLSFICLKMFLDYSINGDFRHS